MDEDDRKLLNELRDYLAVVVPLLKKYEPLLERIAKMASPSSIWKR